MTTTLIRMAPARRYLAKVAPSHQASRDFFEAFDVTASSLSEAIEDTCSLCGEDADCEWLLYAPEEHDPVVTYPDAPLPGGLVLPSTFAAICGDCRARKVQR